MNPSVKISEYGVILDQHFNGIKSILAKLENEKQVFLERNDISHAETQKTKEKLSVLLSEKDQLDDELKSNKNSLRQARLRISELENMVKSNQKKYLEKAKSWKKFLNTIEMKCSCGLGKRLKMVGFDSAVCTGSSEVSLPASTVRNNPLTNETHMKNKCVRLFEVSNPSEIKEAEQLAPMTEQFTEVLSQNDSSTPVIGETEFVPNFNFENEIEDSWKSSPSLLCGNNDQLELTREKQKFYFKRPSEFFETPKRKLPCKYNTSDDLFSDTSPTVKTKTEEKPDLKQVKINASSWFTSKPVQIEKDTKRFEKIGNDKIKNKTKHGTYNIEKDSFFNDHESDEDSEQDDQVVIVEDFEEKKHLTEVMRVLPYEAEQDKSLKKLTNEDKENDQDESMNNLDGSAFFDKLLNKKNRKPDFKFSEVVRKKGDRGKLKGFDCEECRKYYASDQLTEQKLKEVLKQCSRHRHQSTPPPSTPDEFWKIAFPNTQECREKGYLLYDDQDLPDHVKPKWAKGAKKRVKYQ